jgi:hypothetical protein
MYGFRVFLTCGLRGNMRLNSLKLILQDVFVLSARVEPIYLRLKRTGAQQSFHLHFRM